MSMSHISLCYVSLGLDDSKCIIVNNVFIPVFMLYALYVHVLKGIGYGTMYIYVSIGNGGYLDVCWRIWISLDYMTLRYVSRKYSPFGDWILGKYDPTVCGPEIPTVWRDIDPPNLRVGNW